MGFDTNVYPGDRAMAAWKQSGEYEWVGYYLSAPCHSDNSWSGTRSKLLQNGWGLAVIYVGQQTWGKSYGPVTTTKKVRVATTKHGKRHVVIRTMKRTSTIPVATSDDGHCSASFVNTTQGGIDARDAIATTAREGFPRGTVVFLDVEYMDALPQRMRDYYRAWTQKCSPTDAIAPASTRTRATPATIYDDVSEEYDSAGVDGDPPFWIAGKGSFSPESSPTEVGHAFATAWQGMLDVVRTHNGVKLPSTSASRRSRHRARRSSSNLECRCRMSSRLDVATRNTRFEIRVVSTGAPASRASRTPRRRSSLETAPASRTGSAAAIRTSR